MTTRTTTVHRARSDALRIRIEAGRELRIARVTAGTSQREAGGRAGMSHSQFGRIERGAIRQLTIDQLCRASAAVGLRLIARAVPDGDPAAARSPARQRCDPD
ncbi:MAG: hypothetical protein E6I65_01995 [Chloroflexi bacterium]|nr:MAG: hypothetical protein E6I65_01995 [Chloroflexota bacterium]